MARVLPLWGQWALGDRRNLESMKARHLAALVGGTDFGLTARLHIVSSAMYGIEARTVGFQWFGSGRFS